VFVYLYLCTYYEYNFAKRSNVFVYLYLCTYYEYNFAACNCLYLVKENILSTCIVLNKLINKSNNRVPFNLKNCEKFEKIFGRSKLKKLLNVAYSFSRGFSSDTLTFFSDECQTKSFENMNTLLSAIVKNYKFGNNEYVVVIAWE